MPLSQEPAGSKILGEIEIYNLTRAELLCSLCYEIPCNRAAYILVILQLCQNLGCLFFEFDADACFKKRIKKNRAIKRLALLILSGL